MIQRPKVEKRQIYDIVFSVLLTYIVFSQNYSLHDILTGYVPDDLYQDMANAFRSGRLAIVDDTDRVYVDTVPVGDKVYAVWGPFPALVYALLDLPCLALGLPPFPKALLFFSVAVAHLYFVLAITRFFFSGRIWLAHLSTAAYALSFPFCYLGIEGLRVHHVSINFATTLFLAGMHEFRRFEETGKSGVRAAVLFSLAGLSRALMFLPVVVLALLAIVFSRRKETKTFVLVIFSGVCCYLVYNVVRFHDPFEFGETALYNGRWDEEVFGLGILEFDILRTLVRVLEALFAYFGLPRPSSEINTLYIYNQTFFGLLEFPWLLFAFLGFKAAVKKASREIIPIALTLCGSATLGYHLLFGQDHEIRYQFDFTPCFFVSAMGAAGVFTLGKRKILQWLAFAFLMVLPMVLTISLKAHINKEMEVEEAKLLPFPHRVDYGVNGAFFFAGRTASQEITCEQIEPVIAEQHEIPERQRAITYIGLYRFQDGRCEASFYSGATLRLSRNASCFVELDLDERDIKDCRTVRFYADGHFMGYMEKQEAPTGVLRCVYALPYKGEGLVQARFVVEPVPFRSRDWVRETPRYGIFAIRSRCGEMR